MSTARAQYEDVVVVSLIGMVTPHTWAHHLVHVFHVYAHSHAKLTYREGEGPTDRFAKWCSHKS